MRGRRLSSGNEACDLPNTAAVLRAKQPLVVGLVTKEYYEAPYHRWFSGKLAAIRNDSWTIAYPNNNESLVVKDENEIRVAIDVCALPEWPLHLAKVKGAFQYLESRLTDDCQAPYMCEEQHRITGVLRAFNPAFAHGKVNAFWVSQLAELPLLADTPEVEDRLNEELPTYLGACK
eukprot:scaffold24926_cov27-Tisochrysis_lutea.AAC.1